MKVTLNQEEIFTAIENYILETVRVGDNIRLDMDLAATRGAEGYTAMVTFVDITDESANPKDDVVPTEEAQGLSIVDKINEARKAPRRSPSKLPGFRQGSTAGQPIKATTVNIESAEKSKPQPVDEQSSDLATEATENSDDVVVKHAPPKQVEAPAEVDTAEQVTAESEDHEVAENPAPDYQPEPATEAEAEQNEKEPAEESAQEPQEEEKPVQATSTQPRKRSLFADPEPAPQDEAALAAEAAATEPAEEEDVDYTPTPETKGLESEDAGDPVETEKPKTRSLFGNLTKPNNG